jgi:hypothetical protein
MLSFMSFDGKFSKLNLKKNWNKNKINIKNFFSIEILLQINNLKNLYDFRKNSLISLLFKNKYSFDKLKFNQNFFCRTIAIFFENRFRSFLNQYSKSTLFSFILFIYLFSIKKYKFQEIYIIFFESKLLRSRIYSRKLIDLIKKKKMQNLTKELFLYFLNIRLKCNLLNKFYLTISNKFNLRFFLEEIFRRFLRKKTKYFFKIRNIYFSKVLEFFLSYINSLKLVLHYESFLKINFRNRILIKLILKYIN